MLTQQQAAAVVAGDEERAATLAWLRRLVRDGLARQEARREEPPARQVQTAP